MSVTARHYARWTGGDAYRSPLAVGKDEVPTPLPTPKKTKPPEPIDSEGFSFLVAGEGFASEQSSRWNAQRSWAATPDLRVMSADPGSGIFVYL